MAELCLVLGRSATTTVMANLVHVLRISIKSIDCPPTEYDFGVAIYPKGSFHCLGKIIEQQWRASNGGPSAYIRSTLGSR